MKFYFLYVSGPLKLLVTRENSICYKLWKDILEKAPCEALLSSPAK